MERGWGPSKYSLLPGFGLLISNQMWCNKKIFWYHVNISRIDPVQQMIEIVAFCASVSWMICISWLLFSYNENRVGYCYMHVAFLLTYPLPSLVFSNTFHYKLRHSYTYAIETEFFTLNQESSRKACVTTTASEHDNHMLNIFGDISKSWHVIELISYFVKGTIQLTNALHCDNFVCGSNNA